MIAHIIFSPNLVGTSEKLAYKLVQFTRKVR